MNWQQLIEWKNGILRIINDLIAFPEQAQSISENALTFANEHFGSEMLTQKLLHFYNSNNSTTSTRTITKTAGDFQTVIAKYDSSGNARHAFSPVRQADSSTGTISNLCTAIKFGNNSVYVGLEIDRSYPLYHNASNSIDSSNGSVTSPGTVYTPNASILSSNVLLVYTPNFQLKTWFPVVTHSRFFDIQLDISNSILICGRLNGSSSHTIYDNTYWTNVAISSSWLNHSTDLDGFVMKYDASGAFQWVLLVNNSSTRICI
jgi:hypothetical protein